MLAKGKYTGGADCDCRAAPSMQLRTDWQAQNAMGSYQQRSARGPCSCTGTGPLTVSAAWMFVPSMPTSPSFCSFPGCSAKARGLTFLARMCALHRHRQHELSRRQQEPEHSAWIMNDGALPAQHRAVSTSCLMGC